MIEVKNKHGVAKKQWRRWVFNDVYERLSALSLNDLFPPGVVDEMSEPEVRKTLMTVSTLTSTAVDRLNEIEERQ